VIKNAANRLLTPTYYIPTDDPHDAIVLGRFPFIGRPILRQVIREFTHPSAYSARVLVIRGDAPGGKSYSWWYLHHLAVSMVNATALVLHLKDTGYTPRQLFEQVALLLSIPTADLPDMTDNPQFARVDELVNWLKGRLPSLVRPYWLVIDDLNDESVTPALREAAYAIAYCAEVQKMNLWIALLGYSPPITDPSLRFILQEDAQFPEAAFVATYLARLAGLSPLPLPPARAQELANLIFSKYPNMDKESMDKISQEVEVMGQKLRIGQQP
jgi:hypothetical protein